MAGLPPVFGLYAGIIPLAIFALFPARAMSWAARGITPFPQSWEQCLSAFLRPPLRVEYALALALMCGLLFFVFWLFRLAFLANFLSPGRAGRFITGLGIEVLRGQKDPGGCSFNDGCAAIAEHLHSAMATSVHTTGYFVELIALFESIPRANLYAVAIGLGAFLSFV